jgi:transposase InsO family protein
MAQTLKYEDYLKSIYYDPKHSGSFGGVDKLFRAVRKEGKFVLSRKKISDWLLKQEDYAVHREERANVKRRRVIAPFVDYQWDVDTANMEYYKKHNEGYAYFLLAVDILSKYVWTVAVRGRTGKEIVKALQGIFTEGRKPTKLRSDPGTEYSNRDVRGLLKKEGVQYFVTHNLVKASYAERSIKTIKGRLVRYMTRHQTHRWVDILADVTKSYNNTYHRSIKRTPQSVKPDDSASLWQLQYEVLAKAPAKRSTLPRISQFKFKVGDLVRVSFMRRPFQREYDERWSRELFVINQRFMTEYIPQYRLKDYAGEEITGTFYQNQLKRAFKQETYLVEKTIGSRKRGGEKQYLVRWKGWPSKYDTWIREVDFKSLSSAKVSS